MNTGGTIVLVIVLLLLAAGVGYIVFARLRAQRLGLPPPPLLSLIPFVGSRQTYGIQPAPSGIGGWIQARIQGFKARNNRTAAGAYEGAPPSHAPGGRRGFGPLDPDDAWDSRVGAEADAYYYNEEQELGLNTNTNTHTANRGLDASHTAYLGSSALGNPAYNGSSYDMNVPAATSDEPRGRSRDRSPAGNAPAAATAPVKNPFDDDAHPSSSLRGVSPRPIDGDDDAHKADSPTERRSMFRENV